MYLAIAHDPVLGCSDAAAAMRLEDLPDERITPRALRGDRDAWNVLIKRHERSVLLRLLARGVRFDRAKDIVQDTWARLIQLQRDGRLESLQLPGLAITQATYLALETTRRDARDVAIDEVPEVSRLLDPEVSIEERLAARVDLDQAVRELERCSPQARRLFSMVYDEPGTPHAEAAKEIGISVQRVRQTLCEVRARLRKAMERTDVS